MLETRDKLTAIKGIGDTSAKRFAGLGITTVGGLIMHYPFRYESYAWPVKISEINIGELVTIEAIINASPHFISAGKYTISECTVRDDSGIITLRWYNSPYINKQLKPGSRLIFRGKVNSKNNRTFISQPEIFTKEKYREMLKTLKPVYSSKAGLGQAVIRKAMQTAFDELVLKDYLPAETRKAYELPGLRQSLNDIHFPKDEKVLGESLRRMVFDEFFFFFSNMRLLKEDEVIRPNDKKIIKHELADQIRDSLTWELTGDQKKALSEIYEDMAGERVMQRLLQGDVGSGKTVVALLSLAAVCENSYQGCIMAPTEVLAKQHHEYFSSMLEPFGIKTAFLSGSMTKKQKMLEYERIESGEAAVVIGTHAAIQEGVKFKNLALAVIDEQHRFGVRQREALELKGENVHLLLMSATPIPRTYALMLYGDMDISVLAEMPANRKPIKNCVADESMREAVNRFLIKEITAGHQCYVICPLVEESEKTEAAAVTEYAEELKKTLPGNITVASLNGRMKADEKNDIMEKFAAGETNILVSTTVIEVGINVPNATVMLIENAENFGLAQLHQIRGRVGRGKDQSYCIFMSSKKTEAAKKRLETVAGSNDGFYIASQDMKLRGPGDFFGTRQSGEHQFLLADPLRDGEIMAKAKEAVSGLSPEEIKDCLKKRNDIVSHTEYMVY